MNTISTYKKGDRVLVDRNIRPHASNQATITSVMRNKPNLYRIQYDGTKRTSINTVHSNHFALIPQEVIDTTKT